MTETDRTSFVSLLEQCAERCESCATNASGIMPDRRIIVYCRDTGQKCKDLAEDLRAASANVGERAEQCIHSIERTVDLLQMQPHSFCRDCMELCRRTAARCREVAVPQSAKLL